MKIQCECGAPVRAENVNLTAAVATCAACGAVFSIAQSAPVAPRPVVAIPDAFAAPRADVAAPGYRDPARAGVGARWVFRWFRWTYVALALFLVFWDGICATFVVGAFYGGGALGAGTFLLPHVWIGIALTYWTLAHLFNRTTIELDEHVLRVRSGPIPWPRAEIARSEIRGIDVTRGWGKTPANATSMQVRAIDSSRRARRLLGSLSEEEANYLAGEMRHALGMGA